jgi:hypothetical protein
MSVNGKFKEFLEDDLLKIADRFAVGRVKIVMAKVRGAIREWPSLRERAGLSKTLIEAIRATYFAVATSKPCSAIYKGSELACDNVLQDFI